MLAALTLLSALLSLCGDRLGQGRMSRTCPGHAVSPRLETGGFWNTVTRVVTVRPWLSILGGGGGRRRGVKRPLEFPDSTGFSGKMPSL